MHERTDAMAAGNAVEVRITSLNVERSRKVHESASRYRLYFQLTHEPTMEWNCQFGLAWKRLCPGHKVEIDRGFVVLHAELHEVAPKFLPLLKLAVREANAAYLAFTVKESTERRQQEQVWLHERDGLDALASSLHFD